MSKRTLFALRPALLLSVLSCPLFVLGCDDGGSEAGPDDDAGDEPMDGGSDAAQPAGDAASDAHVDGGSLRDDSGAVISDSAVIVDAGDAAVPGADAEVTAEQLVAAKAGRVWTYAVTPDGSSTACTMASITRTVSQIYEEQGTRFIQFTGPCGEGYLNRVVGQNVEQQYGSDWHLALAAPIREGARFMSIAPYEFEWHFLGQVTVQAGTFGNCWLRRSTKAGLNDTTYCPGVGKVRASSADRFALELTAVTP